MRVYVRASASEAIPHRPLQRQLVMYSAETTETDMLNLLNALQPGL